MKILTVYYYSGTGRCAAFVRLLVQHLQNHFTIEVINIETGAQGTGEDCIVVYPLYAGNLPGPAQNFFLSDIPAWHKQVTLIAGTSLMCFGRFHLIQVKKIALREGITIGGFGLFHLPSDFRPFRILQKLSITETPETEASLMAGAIKSYSLFVPNLSAKDFFVRILGKVGAVVLQKMMKGLRVSGKCTRCGKCIRNCPSGNIEMFRGIQFGKKCVHCFRCVTFCPAKAISFPGNGHFFFFCSSFWFLSSFLSLFR